MNALLRGTTTQSLKAIPARLALIGLALGLTFATPMSAQAQPAEAGLWYDDTGRGAVELVPCGQKLCGRIAWLKELVNAEGNPLVDRYNPNPARRTTPICGLQVVGDAQKLSDGTWDQGWIYDPKTGASYNVALSLQTPDQLKVTGYKGIKLLSKSFTWTRAPADLPRCDAAAAGSAKAAPKAEALPWAAQ
ncbi:MAG: DUF2147 domain-containing protein [Hyphomicrobium sp.]|jgi:uncharacterized protein (DUF2147 family)|nr:DUF2147 domain-containing protein [Hyphomicrobium sp.]PPD09516.1 MAG: hypothetical protein CTY28_01505 [Hyphomicrobium sp.]